MSVHRATATVLGVPSDAVSAYTGLVALVVATVGLGAVLLQLRQAEKTALLSVALQIDALLAQYGPQRNWVNENHRLPAGKQSIPQDIVPYMAIFERLHVALRHGMISEQVVYEFYSSRLRRLLRTDHVRDLLTQQPHGWQSLIDLALALDDHGRSTARRYAVIVRQCSRNVSAHERRAGPDDDFRRELEKKRSEVRSDPTTPAVKGLMRARTWWSRH